VLARVLTDVDSLAQFVPGWDALAVKCRRPRSAPAFALAWYRHGLPSNGQQKTVVVTDGDDVVGIAPFYMGRTGFGFYEFNMAGPVLFGVEPLCAPGREEEIAAAVGHALAHAEPVPDIVYLDSLPQGSSWPTFMAGGWPRPRPALVSPHSFPWSHIYLGDAGYEGWFGQRSGRFRQRFRSQYRKLSGEGFKHLVSVDASDISERLPALGRCYEARRAGRGGTGHPFDDNVRAIVAEAADKLSGTGRLRLATIERPGEVIAADLMVSAGGHASGWLTGFDEAWAHLSPNFVCMVLSVEDAARVGDTTFDLGSGSYSYKQRFTDDEPIFESSRLVRRGLRPFHTPAQLLPYGARQAMGRMLGRVKGRAD
jgi:CelD/BcsL family acetyltransferase involved in cellulose biosynthesis